MTVNAVLGQPCPTLSTSDSQAEATIYEGSRWTFPYVEGIEWAIDEFADEEDRTERLAQVRNAQQQLRRWMGSSSLPLLFRRIGIASGLEKGARVRMLPRTKADTSAVQERHSIAA